MANFEIKGKEHELKLTYASVKYLNGLYDGGSLELIGRSLMGDIDTFQHIVHAGLFHAEQGYSLADVEQAITDAITAEKLDMEEIVKVSNEVVANSFFYKKMVAKMMKGDEKLKETLDMLTK